MRDKYQHCGFFFPSFFWLSISPFPRRCRDSGTPRLRRNRPSRQPRNPWETGTSGRSWETGQSRAPGDVRRLPVLPDVQPQGTVQQRTQHVTTWWVERIEEATGCVRDEQRSMKLTVVMTKCVGRNGCTGSRNGLFGWVWRSGSHDHRTQQSLTERT